MHPLKELPSIVSSFCGSEIDIRPVHSTKVNLPIVLMESGSWMAVNDGQSQNASAPITSNEEDDDTSNPSRLVQCAKTLPLMWVTESGSLIDFKQLQSKNACF